MAKRILVAVIFVPLLLAVMLLLPSIAWTAVVCLISAAASYELMRATGERRLTLSMQVVTILSAAVLPLGNWAGLGTAYVNLCSFVVMAVCFWCAIRAYDGHSAPVGFVQILVCLFGGVIIPLALAALVELRCMEYGEYLVLFAVLLAFVTDAGADFAGVFLGRHRGVTRVSPNKSVEGYIGGFVAGVVFALIYGLAAAEMAQASASLPSLVLCGLLGAAATEVGDLAFSFVKRQYGVKDFGRILPGHGGMLDRFDSMLFCAPVALFILRFLPVF